jgi:hypothetical protein
VIAPLCLNTGYLAEYGIFDVFLNGRVSNPPLRTKNVLADER